MEEASTHYTNHKLRVFFATILSNCEPSDPWQLWTDYKENLMADFVYKHGDRNINLEDYTLTIIEELIIKFGGKELDKNIFKFQHYDDE